MSHAIITAIAQVLGWLLGLGPLLGGLVFVAFYAGREHAQAEYRIIEKEYKSRVFMPWYGGFLPKAWTKDSLLDLVLPILTLTILGFIL